MRIHGNVSGDMVAFFSNVSVDNGKTISGDTVVFGGKLALADESHIDGQLVLFGGDLQQGVLGRHPGRPGRDGRKAAGC